MANSFHTADLVKGALQKSGELTDGTSYYQTLVLVYLNKVYRKVLSGSNKWGINLSKAWSWARVTKSIVLEPAITAGSVDVTNGSASAVFTTPPTTSQVGNYLKLDNRPTFYKIIVHTGGAGPFTLDAKYVEETGLSLPYKSIRLAYDLGPNIMRLVDPFRAYVDDSNTLLNVDLEEDGKISGLPINILRRLYPLKRLREGAPDRFAQVSKTDEKLEIQFNRFPAKQQKVDADVIEYPDELIDSNDSIPIFPRDHRELLEDGAAQMILGDKNDDREDKFFALTKLGISTMVEDDNRQETNTNPNKGRLIYRPEQVTRDRVREFF